MSEIDPMPPSTETQESENDQVSQVRYRRRRKLFRRMLVAAVLAIFAIAYILLSSEIILEGSTAPAIDAVDHFREYRRRGARVFVQLTIHYHDREGDVYQIKYELGTSFDYFSTRYTRDVYARPSVQRSGAVTILWFECYGRGVDFTISLIDQLGNESNTIDETLECFVPELMPTIQFQATGTASAKKPRIHQ